MVFNIANATGSSGRILNNRNGGHWYRVIGPRDTLLGENGAAVSETTWHNLPFINMGRSALNGRGSGEPPPIEHYLGLVSREDSSGDRQRLGNITKQGTPLLRLLWCEAAIHAVRRDPTLQRFYRRKLQQKGFGKARVAAARKLGIRLWILTRSD